MKIISANRKLISATFLTVLLLPNLVPAQFAAKPAVYAAPKTDIDRLREEV